MTETPLTTFREQFPAIMRLVDESESYHVEITLPHELIGVGASATIIFKHRNGRGFGATWQIDRGQLHGLRSRCFDASKPDDAPGNQEWIEELRRRLETAGATYGEAAGSGSYQWKRAKYNVQRKLAQRAY